MYLQCHPWLLGHYCELEEGRAGLGWGQHREPGDVTLLTFPAVASDSGRFGSPVIRLGAFVSPLSFLSSLQTVSFTFQTG